MAAAKSTAVNNLALSRRTPRCCHHKANGLRCGSPALRGNVLCYFHERWLANAADEVLPPLEDGNGVQFWLMYAVSRLRKEAFGDGRADIPAVKQFLYALQTASNNLRYCSFDPRLKASTTNPFAADEDDNQEDGAQASPPRKPAASALAGDGGTQAEAGEPVCSKAKD